MFKIETSEVSTAVSLLKGHTHQRPHISYQAKFQIHWESKIVWLFETSGFIWQGINNKIDGTKIHLETV